MANYILASVAVVLLVLPIVAFGIFSGSGNIPDLPEGYLIPIACCYRDGSKYFIYFDWQLENITDNDTRVIYFR